MRGSRPLNIFRVMLRGGVASLLALVASCKPVTEIMPAAGDKPAISAPDRLVLARGLTTDEVAQCMPRPMGTSRSGMREVWLYENGTIEFEDGIVIDYTVMTDAQMAAKKRNIAAARRKKAAVTTRATRKKTVAKSKRAKPRPAPKVVKKKPAPPKPARVPS